MSAAGFDVAFARPALLWALALVVPVGLAHLYRRRRRRVAVAFAPLLREAMGPVRARGAWKRLREALRLVARVGAVAALALALAGPRPAASASPPEDLLVVVDADPTTSVVEGPGPGDRRLDRQRALARAHLLAHGRGRVGVVWAGVSPRVVVPLTDDASAAARALDAATVAVAGGRPDLGAAVAAARGARDPARPLRLVLVTSREVPTSLGADVVVEGAGAADDDTGFVDAAIEPRADGATVGVRLTVRHRGRTPVARDVAFAWQDARGAGPPAPRRAIPTRSLALAPDAEAEVEVDVVPPRGGAYLVATLVGGDAWDVDDTFAAFLAPRARPSVLVVHDGAPRPFLRALLEAAGDAIDREASGFVEASRWAGTAPRDVTIVDGAAGLPTAPTAGTWIYVAPFPAAGTPFRPRADVTEPLVWRVAADHPMLRGVDLSTAYVARGTPFDADGATVLASIEGAAVVAEGRAGALRWLAFGLDPDGSDLPLRAAFPLLLRNALRQLGELPLSPLRPFYRLGEPLRARDGTPVALSPTTEGGPASAGAAVTRVGASEAPTSADGGPAGTRFVSTPTGARTTIVPLDRAWDVRPARPASPPPPPAPAPPEDAAARWLRWLLWVAGGLILGDLLMGAFGRTMVARPFRPS